MNNYKISSNIYDEFFKQYEECFNRLPCGICKLTNMPCPKITNYEPNKINYNYIGDKTTNHIISEDINLDEVNQKFLIVTDEADFGCNSWNEVKEIFENNPINSYIIKYYERDKYKGGYTFKELKEKLGVK